MQQFKATTAYPSDPLPQGRWLRYIVGKDLNLEEIDKLPLLGLVIIDGYQRDPEKCVKMIREMVQDNPKMVERVIGKANMQKIL